MQANDPVVAQIRQERLAAAIAKRLGITRAAVSLWERVPPKHVHKLSKFLKLHPHAIRPDIFPKPRKPKGSLKKG